MAIFLYCAEKLWSPFSLWSIELGSNQYANESYFLVWSGKNWHFGKSSKCVFESDFKWFRLQKFVMIFGQILKYPTVLPDRIIRTQLKLDHFYFRIFFCTIVGLTVRPNQKSKQYPIYPTTFRHLWKASNYQDDIEEKNLFDKLNQDFY